MNPFRTDPLRPRLLTLLPLLALLLACQPTAREPLRLGTNVWLGYEPLYLARERGFLAPDQVRLVEMVNASDVMHAFRAGLLEAAALTLDEALVLRAEGEPVKVVAVLDVSDGADALVARPEIAQLDDLRGRRVGFENTAVGAVMLEAALAAAGLGLDAIETVPLTFNEHEAAYRNGRVDAVVTFEPALSHLESEGAVRLFDSSRIPGQVVDVLVARPDTYHERIDDLRALVGAWSRALQELRERPEAAAAHITARNGLTAEQVLAGYDGLQLLDITGNRDFLLGDSPRLLGYARALGATMLERGLLSRLPDLDGFIGADAVGAP